MVATMGWLQKTFWGLALGGGIYVAAMLALTIPTIQRNATYAHNINPTRFQNLSNVDQFGFHHHQVLPFRFNTPDNLTLFAWHILPVHLYRKHAYDLKAQSDFGVKPFEEAVEAVNFRLLADDPDARVVVYFHGNAGHLASAYRPATFQTVLSTSTVERPVHVIAFDYRGFGLSEGTPDEDGVIQDGVTLLSLLTGYGVAGGKESASTSRLSSDAVETKSYVSPAQIILMGQSFGTFVSSAVFEYWVLKLGRPSFKALMLFASFSNLPKLLESYSIKGFTPPLLSPLMSYPHVQKWFMSRVVDKWQTDTRLQNLVNAHDAPFDLTIMHSRDDWEIPWFEGRRNFEAIMAVTEGTGKLTVEEEKDTNIGTWVSNDQTKRVKWEKIQHGGHNRIPTSEQAKAALLEVLER